MVSATDGVGMKNKSLFRKNMLLIIVPILVISMMLIMVTNTVIKRYFREESYDSLYRAIADSRNIENADTLVSDEMESKPPLAGGRIPGSKWSAHLVPNKSVRTSFIVSVEDGQFYVLGQDDALEGRFELEQIVGNDSWPVEGETTIETETVFYSIAPVENMETINRLGVSSSENLYYIAYISESYSADLSKVVMKVFIVGLGVLLVIVTLILFYVFKHITRRMGTLEQGAAAIGKGNFAMRLIIEPYDEIGRLSDAMNRMSIQLELNQEEQADHFQMISHELKTPIMVMQGYLDALIHHQYPSGTREATYRVLEEELNKLNLLTQDIVLLNKLDYLSKNKVEMIDLSLRTLFTEMAERLNVEKSVVIEVLGDMTFIGDEDSWRHVVENLLTNHLRYAESIITVTLDKSISIRNDGPPIEEHLLPKIKQPFVKGKSGRSGLGLAIVSNILKLYHFELDIKNSNDGVIYLITREG
jgi:signal transduction histidine kinase